MTDWKQLRIEHGLSQQQIADQLGTPKQTFVSWEKTQRYPKEIIQKLHQIYQVTPPKSLQIELLLAAHSSGEISTQEFLNIGEELYIETLHVELGMILIEIYIKLDNVDKASEVSQSVRNSIMNKIKYRNPKDAEYLAKLYYLRGTVYYNQKRNIAAYEQLLCAEELLEHIDPNNGLVVRIRRNMAYINSEREDLSDEELEYFIEKEFGNYDLNKGWLEFILGRSKQLKLEYAQALEHFNQSIKYYEEIGSFENSRCAASSAAEMHYKLGLFEKAINVCIIRLKDETRPDFKVDFEEVLGWSYIETDQCDMAKELAANILKRPDVVPYSISRAYRILAKAFKKEENRKAANEHFGKAIDVLYENRLEGTTQSLLLAITHEYIQYNKDSFPV